VIDDRPTDLDDTPARVEPDFSTSVHAPRSSIAPSTLTSVLSNGPVAVSRTVSAEPAAPMTAAQSRPPSGRIRIGGDIPRIDDERDLHPGHALRPEFERAHHVPDVARAARLQRALPAAGEYAHRPIDWTRNASSRCRHPGAPVRLRTGEQQLVAIRDAPIGERRGHLDARSQLHMHADVFELA